MIHSSAARQLDAPRLSLSGCVGTTLGLAFSTALLAAPAIEGPIPGQPSGDPQSANLHDTYPFFATQGGIQLPQVEVPTAINTGDNAGELFCFLFGSYEPLDEQQLGELYRNHGQYVAKVTKSVARNVARGYMLPADGLRDVAEAARSEVGKRGWKPGR